MAHLTRHQRDQLQALHQTRRFTQEDMAVIIGCTQPTVSRELSRNASGRTRRYAALRAQRRTDERRARSYDLRSRWYDDARLRAYVVSELDDRKSPDQIAGRMHHLGWNHTVSQQAIYDYIAQDRVRGGSLYKHLRYQGKKFKWRGMGGSGYGQIPNRVGIEERPAIVTRKRRFGDFESDLVVSCKHGRGAVATFAERTTMYFKAVKVHDQSSEEMVRASHAALDAIPSSLRHTMTHDNGREISKHEQIAAELHIAVYCARPYRSCDRGLNEFMNRELRRFFPKGTDFSAVTQRDVDATTEWLNNCPRRSLNYRTPQEAFEEQLRIMHFTL